MSDDRGSRGARDDLADLPAFDDGRSHSLPGEPEWPVREVVVEYDEGWFVGGYDRVEQRSRTIDGVDIEFTLLEKDLSTRAWAAQTE